MANKREIESKQKKVRIQEDGAASKTGGGGEIDARPLCFPAEDLPLA